MHFHLAIGACFFPVEIQAQLFIFAFYDIALKALYMTIASSLCRAAKDLHRRHSTIFPKTCSA